MSKRLMQWDTELVQDYYYELFGSYIDGDTIEEMVMCTVEELDEMEADGLISLGERDAAQAVLLS